MRRQTLQIVKLEDALTNSALLGTSVELRNLMLIDYVPDAVMGNGTMDFCGRVSVDGEELIFRGIHAHFRDSSDYLEYWLSTRPVFMQGTMMPSPNGKPIIRVDYTNWDSEY